MIRALAIFASAAALIPQHAAALAKLDRANERSPSVVRIDNANRAALIEPSSSGFQQAVQVYPYVTGTLYRLYAAPERITDIALQPGEAVTSVAAGDTVRWTVGDTTSGRGEARRTHILIKPFAPGLRTNLVITTDRRAYYLELESRQATAMAAISWSYPENALLALKGSSSLTGSTAPSEPIGVERLNFNYAITGDKPPWRPLRAFDDGRQTFVEFPASIAVGEAPPLFVLSERGEAQLVNFRMAGRYYVVDRLFGAAELRLGGKRQQIVRISNSDLSEQKHRRKGKSS